ncbi:MAG: WecB/TagA/CpsF family glycosyltransferase [Burkholderiaceae bacterium]
MSEAPLSEIVPIAGFPVRKTTSSALSAYLVERMPRRKSIAVFFANTNLISQCRALLPAMRADRVLIVNDGIGLSIAAWLFHRERFPENLNGTDFTPYLLRQCPTPLRLFLIGASPQNLRKAEAHVREQLGQTVVGAIDGYRDLDDPSVIDRVRASKPDVVLVALGNPLQEAWILRYREALDVGALIGVGALFDFWAGDKPRAPTLVRTLKLEWLFRLVLEPKRLFRRYTTDIVRFLWACYRRR